jgi:hypothetical protein
LHHEAEYVHDDAGVFDASGFQAVDDYASDADLAAGGGDAEEFLLVGAGPFEAGGDFIGFGDLFLDGEVEVGEGGAHCAEDIFEAFDAGALAWKGDLFDDVYPDEVGGGIDVALGDDFVDEAFDDDGVFLGVHG